VAGLVLRSWSDEGIVFCQFLVFLGKLGLYPIHILTVYIICFVKRKRVWAIFCAHLH
jgi:hypothetical protein